MPDCKMCNGTGQVPHIYWDEEKQEYRKLELETTILETTGTNEPANSNNGKVK